MQNITFNKNLKIAQVGITRIFSDISFWLRCGKKDKASPTSTSMYNVWPLELTMSFEKK